MPNAGRRSTGLAVRLVCFISTLVSGRRRARTVSAGCRACRRLGNWRWRVLLADGCAECLWSHMGEHPVLGKHKIELVACGGKRRRKASTG